MKPIWQWLFPLCVFGLAIYIAWSNYPWWHKPEFGWQGDKWFGWIAGTVATLILCAIASGLGDGLASIIGEHCDQIWQRCGRDQMVSMRSADGVHGSFAGGIFMMSGTVDSAQIYYYYATKPDGSFKPKKWRPDGDTSIFEEDRTDGEVIQFDSAFANPKRAWIADTNDRVRMDFHIPKGSIRQQFKLE